MSLTEWVKTLPYKIDSKFSFNFDELQNIMISNRKSDVGFSEEEKLMIKMRPWTSEVWTSHAWWGWISNQFFFTDFFRVRRHLKWFDNKVWVLIWTTWTDLSLGFTWNEFKFNSIKLPLMSDWTIPTTYTSWTDSSWPEQIKVDVLDTTVLPIWQYLVITDDPTNNQVHRGCFASILAVELWEYVLNWAWVTVAVKSWAKYQIYDTLWEHLQIINGIQYEKYMFVKADWTFVENTNYTWLATKNLRNIKAISDTDFVEKQLSYVASYWTFNKWTLYYTSGALNNPFYYLFSTALTMPWNNGWDINDIFIFKDRLIIGWSNFISYIKWISTLTEVKPVTSSYWIEKNSLVDLWVDSYYITTNKQIYSLSETITGALNSENVGKIMNNYLKDFNYWICAGYDWRNLYFYWQKDATTIGKIIVLDIEYKFWSTYTGLRPSSIVLEQGSVYLTDNNSSIVRHFSDTTLDIAEIIEQKISIKDIDLWDPFSLKKLTDIYLWLDNYTQSLLVDTYLSLSKWNAKKATNKISITEVDVTWATPSMWSWIMWTNIIWWFAAEPNATYPQMSHIQYSTDNANIWKVIITWFEWSPFYLNHLDIEIWFTNTKSKAYFNPAKTI